jgi:hypothetical protein
VNGAIHVNLWSLIASRLFDMTGRTYSADQCRTKFSRLKMNYREFSDLLNHQIGFGWDPIANTVHGTETQWQQYLRVKFIKPCHSYLHIMRICKMYRSPISFFFFFFVYFVLDQQEG